MSTNSQTKLRRRWSALAGSLLLHVVLVLALFAGASGVVSRGGEVRQDDGDSILVSLSGFEGVTAGGGGANTQTAKDADSLMKMMASLRSGDSDLTVSEESAERPRGDLSKLFAALGQVDGSGRVGAGRDATGQKPDHGRQAQTASASAQGDPSTDVSSGDLWGQVEPCWRRLPQRSLTPVSLEVVLNDQGGLARPPRIIRDASAAPDESRLVAEARALTAIAACLPYRQVVLPGSQRVFKLTFQPSQGG